MHQQIETVVLLGQGHPVERAVSGLRRDAPTIATEPASTLRSDRIEKHIDSPVRGRLERSLPTGAGAPVAPRLIPPAPNEPRLALLVQAPDEGFDDLPQSRRTRARAGLNEADQKPVRFAREQPLDLGASLLGRYHHQAKRMKPAQAAV